jgi:hypothetical protein
MTGSGNCEDPGSEVLFQVTENLAAHHRRSSARVLKMSQKNGKRMLQTVINEKRWFRQYKLVKISVENLERFQNGNFHRSEAVERASTLSITFEGSAKDNGGSAPWTCNQMVA